MIGECVRPEVSELRLSRYKSFEDARFALGSLTVLVGPSGAGKSNVMEALSLLGQLAGGAELAQALEGVRGGAPACARQGTAGDRGLRRGFRLGCTVDGPLGPVLLEVAIQVEPEPRIVGERLTGGGQVLLRTALRDPGLRRVHAAWHTAGRAPVERAPLPDDKLASALLPLRVAGKTEGQRLVIAGAEQVLVGLRGVFPISPEPHMMRGWSSLDKGWLDSTAANVSSVVARTQTECKTRYRLLGEVLRRMCPYPVHALTVLHDETSRQVMAAVDRGPLGLMPAAFLGNGELRSLAIALVLLTGPGVLAMDPAEVPDALQLLTVLAEDLDGGLDRRQFRELLGLALQMCKRGHIRVLATAHERQWLEGLDGVTVVELPLR